jgi:hypothetical protein
MPGASSRSLDIAIVGRLKLRSQAASCFRNVGLIDTTTMDELCIAEIF